MKKELREQPKPVQIGESQEVFPYVLELIEDRVKSSEKDYGCKLHSFNGRDALYDALQEAIDCVFYLTQAIMERNKDDN